MNNHHKSINKSVLSLNNNDFTMPLKDPQYSQGSRKRQTAQHIFKLAATKKSEASSKLLQSLSSSLRNLKVHGVVAEGTAMSDGDCDDYVDDDGMDDSIHLTRRRWNRRYHHDTPVVREDVCCKVEEHEKGTADGITKRWGIEHEHQCGIDAVVLVPDVQQQSLLRAKAA